MNLNLLLHVRWKESAELVDAVAEKLTWPVKGAQRGKGKDNIRSWVDAQSWSCLLSKISVPQEDWLASGVWHGQHDSAGSICLGWLQQQTPNPSALGCELPSSLNG